MSQDTIIAQNQDCTTIFSKASQLKATERKSLAIKVVAKTDSVSELSRKNEVSRKFLYKQANIAHKAMDNAFEKEAEDSKVLFYIPVTKEWLRQFVLVLILFCHSSLRGVMQAISALLDYHLSLGSIHNIVLEAAYKAEQINAKEDLSLVTIGVHDEIFQGRNPILVGVSAQTGYCYLLSKEDARDSTTWGVRLLELEEKGLCPEYTIADGGKGLRAGQEEAWPDIACHGDVFHALYDLGKLCTILENRAIGAISACEKIEKKMHRAKHKGHGNSFSKKLSLARRAENIAVELAGDISIMAKWMQEDILCLVGADLQTRKEMFDFVVCELKKREHLLAHRIRPVRIMLENHRDNLLAFCALLEQNLAKLAKEYRVPLALVRSIYELHGLKETDHRRWPLEGRLRKQLGDLFGILQTKVHEILHHTVRASSLVENINSRLRSYFFLRRELGPQYLNLLRFFFNHSRFLRSEHADRVGKSPSELLTGSRHPHWLELLGFKLFKRTA